MEKNYNLINGDCLVEMKNIKSKSVNLILADLPYGTTKCKWDSIIPFEPLMYMSEIDKKGNSNQYFRG